MSEGGRDDVPSCGNEDKRRLKPALSGGRIAADDQLSLRTGPTKMVSIAEPESTSSLLSSLENPTQKQHSVSLTKRLIARPPLHTGSSSHNSLVSQTSMDDMPASQLKSTQQDEGDHALHQRIRHPERLLAQVSEWLDTEKAKRATRKSKKNQGSLRDGDWPNSLADNINSPQGRSSLDSDSNGLSLEKLQKILEDSVTPVGHEHSVTVSPGIHRGPHRRRRPSRTISSDTEYQDGDVIVPSCDVMLDNSKTLSYSGGAAASNSDLNSAGKRAEKERKAWSSFKGEILRLAHTLRLKGWRRVPLDRGDDIEVERLSGALTNAVYVVSPPSSLTPTASLGPGNVHKQLPAKLLLRIYGPQVEHLIDRETELGILRRLARKKIGPRLLGTFRNGRFEQYFTSKTLTYDDIRNPETSKQIAKRMRELHDGIELLEQERDDGPFVWLNWDKWVDRCERVITYLDDQILSGQAGSPKSKSEAWKGRGLVCGVEWPTFRMMVEKYRIFLMEQYGGTDKLRDMLVFAHNDTQYGNILRLVPSGESPLLLPANSHKQLIVIDFEYASANTPGLEFANHFTEWCYNYHDPVSPYACNTANYPTPEEQRRFIRSYVNHNPRFNAKPGAAVSAGPGSSLSDFMLDSRSPGGVSGTYAEEEDIRIKITEQEVERLVGEARLWRVANSAQWVAWGIVQAKVLELDDLEYGCQPSNTPNETQRTVSPKVTPPSGVAGPRPSSDIRLEGLPSETIRSDGDTQEAKELEAENPEDEFDYLGYARDRAMFFWGDIINLGLCSLEELPLSVREFVKVVRY